jgi:hypothetical protein
LRHTVQMVVRWRDAHYRLMSFSLGGKIDCVACGTLPYLELLGRRSRVRGRKWIELNIAPANLPMAPALQSLGQPIAPIVGDPALPTLPTTSVKPGGEPS